MIFTIIAKGSDKGINPIPQTIITQGRRTSPLEADAG
jgi:hypothetical protein